MIKNRKIFLTNIVLILFFVACKKQTVTAVKNDDFAIEYQFINQGDINIRDVIMHTFQKVIVFNEIKKFDTVRFSVTKTKCGECIDYLKVFVRFKEMQYSTLAAAKGYNNAGTALLAW